MDINNQMVGNRIKQLRLNFGMTLEEFGEKFKTSKSTVYNWERGRNLPNKENLKLIADIGDISVNELLYGSTREYLVPIIKEAVKKYMYIDIDNEEAHHIYNRLDVISLANAYQYDADKFYSENDKLLEKLLLDSVIFNKWGLVNYSIEALSVTKREITSNYNAMKKTDGDAESHTYESIINIINAAIEEVRRLNSLDEAETLDI